MPRGGPDLRWAAIRRGRDTHQLQRVVHAEVEKRQNRIMQTLTIVTTIFLRLTLLVGWYGMTFVGMPGLTWKYGYPVVVVVSIVTVRISLWVGKKKKFW